jgi:GxxExxY protein
MDNCPQLDNCPRLDKGTPLEQKLQNIVNEIIKELGAGHRECVYHRAFEIELRNRRIDYECEVVVPLFYKGHFISHLRLDLVIAKTYIVELKATKSLKSEDSDQLKRYMKATGIPKGLVVNFWSGEVFPFTIEATDL